MTVTSKPSMPIFLARVCDHNHGRIACTLILSVVVAGHVSLAEKQCQTGQGTRAALRFRARLCSRYQRARAEFDLRCVCKLHPSRSCLGMGLIFPSHKPLRMAAARGHPQPCFPRCVTGMGNSNSHVTGSCHRSCLEQHHLHDDLPACLPANARSMLLLLL